ncbi:MAG: class IV adenylate cyclase [Patescibacteria group bacterium]|nr:class IV adenylate cyclase [Patescibacteria group bacterium]
MEEIELTYINIDKKELEQKLIALGAQKVGDYHYRRIVFDYPDFQLDKQSSWVRLRDEGNKVTLAFKQRLGESVRDKLTGDDGMYECETVVEDFDKTREILLKIGLIEKMYQENKRTRYVLDGVECDIDTWPLLDPYLEIEGQTWDEVHAIARKLGLKPEDGKKFSTNQIYRLKGLDDRNYTKLTFTEQIERRENRF